MRLKDVLDLEVDDSYYLSEDIANKMTSKITKGEIKQVGQIYPNSGNPQAGRIYDPNGISPTLDTCAGGNRMPKIVVGGSNE